MAIPRFVESNSVRRYPSMAHQMTNFSQPHRQSNAKSAPAIKNIQYIAKMAFTATIAL